MRRERSILSGGPFLVFPLVVIAMAGASWLVPHMYGWGLGDLVWVIAAAGLIVAIVSRVRSRSRSGSRG